MKENVCNISARYVALMRLAAGPKFTNLYNHISFITFKNITGRNVTNFNINTSILIYKISRTQ